MKVLVQVLRAAGALAVIAAAVPALAQRPAPEREREVLGVQLTVSGASSRQDFGESEEAAQDIPQLRSAFYADINGSMRYAPQPVGGVSVALTATSAVRRYEGGGEFVVVGHSAGATMSWALRERTSLAATGAFTYMPSYSINATPMPDAATAAETSGTLPANAVDYSLTRRTLFGTVGGVTLSHNLSRRLNLGVAYSASRQEFELEEDPSYLSHSMSGRLTYSLTRGLGVRAGFGRRLASFTTPDGGEDQIALDDIDVGLVFSEAIGITRTTRLSFSTGSSIRSDEGERSANLIGTATLSQELGRRGQIALSYNRGSELTPGFSKPVFSDSLSLSANYQLARSLVASVSAFGSLGEAGLSSASERNRVQAMSGSARLAYAVTRRLQAYGEYLAYRNLIDQSVSLISTVPRDRTSHAVRVGVAIVVPLVTALPPRRGN